MLVHLVRNDEDVVGLQRANVLHFGGAQVGAGGIARKIDKSDLSLLG